MRVALYVHAFDLAALEDHGGLARLRDLGITELCLAASYHDGRWLTPWHGQRRVRFLEDGTVHFRPCDDYGRLQPRRSSEVADDGPSPLQALCAAAPSAGLAVRAWTVFGHNSRLGVQAPDVTVENAFGDRYPYALCPAQADVQRYHTTLVRDLAAHEGLGSIEFEALGQMGIQHSSHHDKKSIVAVGLLAFALSACFCPACLAVHAQVGGDGERVRAQVRAFVTTHVSDADAMAPTTVPGNDAELDAEQRQWVDAVLQARAATIAPLAAAVSKASGACARAVQVHPDRWFTGSQLSAASATAFAACDERVLTCYGDGPDALAAMLARTEVAALDSSPRRLCIWPKAPQFTCDDDVRKVKQLCAQHEVGTLAIYHLGLLPWRTLQRVAAVLAS